MGTGGGTWTFASRTPLTPYSIRKRESQRPDQFDQLHRYTQYEEASSSAHVRRIRLMGSSVRAARSTNWRRDDA
jgi:hypothetical protein